MRLGILSAGIENGGHSPWLSRSFGSLNLITAFKFAFVHWFRPAKRCPGFEISLVRLSETSKNDSWTSEIPAGLVRRKTTYFWFSHKLHWLYIFQTSEWYIRTSDFYNPLARQTSAFNLKFGSLVSQMFSCVLWLDDDNKGFKSDHISTKDIPSLALMEELWSVCSENLGEKLLCCKQRLTVS